MLFNGANINENIDISANGSRVRFTRDVANITMDLNDVEAINFNALGGADNVTVNDLSGTDVTPGQPQPRPHAGGGAATARPTPSSSTAPTANDIVDDRRRGHRATPSSACRPLVNVTGSEGANDSLVVNALGGNDSVSRGHAARRRRSS